jgi:pimeloyl-ACP methyl ester carboxylesterase
MKTKLVFLHGLESGPHGSKYHALRQLDPDLLAPDCTGLTGIGERLDVIEAELAATDRMVIVGSSFGGLAALLFAQREHNRHRVAACLLCAPALPLAAPGSITWLPEHTAALHGTRDEVIAYRASEEFCANHGIRLVAVDDDHRLAASAALMVSLTEELLRDSASS